ncbi:3-oxo-tetronate kinase [Rhodococcus koreensis]|uniref:3-oxo-tetronate kinase n=1 Tax=Rhodococcus koreensis TaxID=99653 RepID=UPI00197FEBC2|nr:3-oxo-tetronate kinase [Rhodococcus koreensis]QSE84974.1 four-carbon acid sugar kinase family protein [Rhodococcus koreensis]
MTTPIIGCIADDYTGGTDVAAALRRGGLNTVLLFGPPDPHASLDEPDAVVIALKTRSLPAAQAVETSLTAQQWLRERGVAQDYFKYCSTFDSTDDGNIGPVTDALLTARNEAVTVICPAAPEHGRTVYQGHLFVHDRLLSESSMRHHPLTPMTDADLIRVLQRQTSHPVALVPLQIVHQGADAITDRITELAADGVRHVVVDAVDESDLDAIATATRALPIVTGSAGLAGAVGRITPGAVRTGADPHPTSTGPTVVFAGSCSQTTLGQVALAREKYASYRLDPRTVDTVGDLLPDAHAWLTAHLGDDPILIYSSAPADERGPADPHTAEQLEKLMGDLARTAVNAGAHRLVVAGGETSGAVVDALGVTAVRVDAEADRGVPWCTTLDTDQPVTLLLKSGNFGTPDLLVRAALLGPAE